METEVMTPTPAPEFNFESACTSPFITAPSTPSFTTPFPNDDFDFDFDFATTLHRPSISHADDLFFDGQIKPLKPPPRVQYGAVSSPNSPKSPGKILIEALSPKFKKKEIDPFEEAIKQSTRENRGKEGRERTRERKAGIRTRSLSPFRVSDILSEKDHDSPKSKSEKQNNLFSFPKSAWKRYKNWKLKDFLLFRSVSEGRKDEIRHVPIKSYSSIHKNFQDDIKNSSFRSIESSGSVGGSGSGSGMRRKGSLSDHYAVNRAVQEEMKKKTPLPYKHGLMGMGCLGLEPAIQDLVKSLGSTRG